MNQKNSLSSGKLFRGGGGVSGLCSQSLRGSERKKGGLIRRWKLEARAGALCMLCMLILLSACEPPEPSPELNIDLGMILPEEWKAVSTWESINIDADTEDEYLLFYRYDASTTADGEEITGPIGAVIYDSQTPIGMPEESEDSSRPAGAQASAVCAATQLLARFWFWLCCAAASGGSSRVDRSQTRRSERDRKPLLRGTGGADAGISQWTGGGRGAGGTAQSR